MKKILLSIVFVFGLGLLALAGEQKSHVDEAKYTTVKNRLFSVSIPKELDGIYKTEIKKDMISFYHKESKKAGFGGFAFAIRAYENPADHAFLPGGKKIGELTDKNGVLHDMVLKYPTDVQYDYTKGTEAPESFKALYDSGKIAIIHGVKKAKYHKNQGTKGKDLYNKILDKYIQALKDKRDSSWLEKNKMSYMYYVVAQELNTDQQIFDKIGYAYYDVNDDGIEELLIGEIADGEWKGIVYDIYTMVNRTPSHVISGGARDRYFVCDDVFICNEYSSGANESGTNVYILEENTNKLFHQVSFKYDAYTNPKNPWFISYGSEIDQDKWENMDETEIQKRKSVFDKYMRFDYTPLSKYIISQKLQQKIFSK